MSLSKIVQELKELDQFLKEDVSAGPVETMAARRGRQRQAIETHKRLTEEYTRTFSSQAIFIIPVGPKKQEFLTATSEYCFSSDVDSFAKNLVDRLPPVTYMNLETGSSIFELVGRHLMDLALDLNILEYPLVRFDQKYRKFISSKEELKDLMVQAINDQMGAEIVGIYAARTLAVQGIEKGYIAPITPIVLMPQADSQAMELVGPLTRLTKNVFIVATGKTPKAVTKGPNVLQIKEINENNVEEVLTTIKNNVKK
jgi:hypothetical protein